jgi:hypothetical protein
VTTQRQEGGIRLQREAGTQAVGAEHEPIAHQSAVVVAHEVRAVVT